MAKFLSLLNLGEAVPSLSGSSIVDEYVDTVDQNGVACIQIIGQKNLQEEINAAFEDTLVYKIIDRYLNGDTEALNVVNGSFVDITKVPRDLIEAHKQQVFAINSFKNLPVEVRALFDNDPNKFALSENPMDLINKAFSKNQNVPDPVLQKEVVNDGTV